MAQNACRRRSTSQTCGWTARCITDDTTGDCRVQRPAPGLSPPGRGAAVPSAGAQTPPARFGRGAMPLAKVDLMCNAILSNVFGTILCTDQTGLRPRPSPARRDRLKRAVPAGAAERLEERRLLS